MKFALYNSLGVITATGECPDGMEARQKLEGTEVFVGEAFMHDSIDVATGALLSGVKPAPSYLELRRYPPVAQQLDALWHAMNTGEIPIATAFYEGIKAIKDANPKPEPVNPAYLMPEE